MFNKVIALNLYHNFMNINFQTLLNLEVQQCAYSYEWRTNNLTLFSLQIVDKILKINIH